MSPILRIALAALIGFLLWPADFPQAAEPTFSPGENFLVPVLKGWKLNTTDNQNDVITSEFIPEGESTAAWAQLMSMQIFIGKRDLTPNAFAKRMIAAFGGRCDSYDGGRPLLSRANGYLSSQILLICGRNKTTGKGSLTVIRAIAGTDNFYVVQRAWHGDSFKGDRTPISKAQFKDWTSFMQAVSVCDTRKADHPCDAKNYTPFWPPEKNAGGG